MRGVSDGATTTLVAAQWAATRIPYFKLYFTSHDGGTNVDLSTDSATYGDRILGIDHREEDSEDGGTAIITLNNYDSTLPDLRGYWVGIGYGLTTGSGNEYASTPRLWVKSQSNIWYRGQYLTILELEDFWCRMQEIPVHNIGTWSKPFFYNQFQCFTVLELLKLLINGETAGDSTSLVLQANITLDESDGIIDVYVPYFEVNDEASIIINPSSGVYHFGNADSNHETLFSAVHRLLQWTACYMRMKPSNAILIVYPGSSSTPDITYYRDTSPQWTSFVEKNTLVRPNKVIVFGGADTDPYVDAYDVTHPGWYWEDAMLEKRVIEGSYEDTTETARYEDVLEFLVDPSIQSVGLAEQVAEVRGTHRQPTDSVGRVILRHDCRVELWDRVAVITNA